MQFRIIIFLTLGLAGMSLSQQRPCVEKPTVITLSVQGNRNATGHWKKDVNLEFDGRKAPENWDVDFKEEDTQDNGYSFSASARVEGSPSRYHHVYRNDRRNFTDARNTCRGLGADLAVINSEQEAADIEKLIQENRTPTSFIYAFVGFFHADGEWRTTEGTLLRDSGFPRWEPRQPSNSSFVQQPSGQVFYENCGSVGLQGLLNDSPCEIRMPFICEFKLEACGTA